MPDRDHNAALSARQVDQTPGKSGLVGGAEEVVWKCLIIGCGTSNSLMDPQCASCQCVRPSVDMVNRAKRYQQAVADRIAKEKQDIVNHYMQRLQSLREKPNEEQFRAPQQPPLLSREDLVTIAFNKNSKLVKELGELSAHDPADVINKVYSFYPPGRYVAVCAPHSDACTHTLF